MRGLNGTKSLIFKNYQKKFTVKKHERQNVTVDSPTQMGTQLTLHCLSGHD